MRPLVKRKRVFWYVAAVTLLGGMAIGSAPQEQQRAANDRYRRQKGLEALAERSDDQSLTVLTQAMWQDPDEHIRRTAVSSLGQSPHPRALAALTGALGTTGPVPYLLQERVIETLAGFRMAGGLPVLLNLIAEGVTSKDPRRIQLLPHVIVGVGKYQKPALADGEEDIDPVAFPASTVPTLIEAFHAARSEELKWRLLSLLGQLRLPDALPFLIALAHPASVPPPANDSLRAQAVKTLGEFHHPLRLVPVYAKLIVPEERGVVRMAALECLEAVGNEDAERVVAATLPLSFESDQPEASDWWRAAVSALLTMARRPDSIAKVAAYAQTYRGEEFLANRLIEFLRRVPRELGTPHLVHLMLKAVRGNTRFGALKAIEDRWDPKAEEAVRSALLVEPDRAVKLGMLKVYAEHGDPRDPRWSEMLRRYAQDPDPGIRQTAEDLLKRLNQEPLEGFETAPQ